MEDLLWYSPLFFPSTRAHWGLADVQGTSRFRVIDLIYIVYALHVTTFYDVSRWGDERVSRAPCRVCRQR